MAFSWSRDASSSAWSAPPPSDGTSHTEYSDPAFRHIGDHLSSHSSSSPSKSYADPECVDQLVELRTSPYGWLNNGSAPSSVLAPWSEYNTRHHLPRDSPTSSDSLILDCAICSRSFTGEYRKGNYQRHMRQKHGTEEKIYRCEASECHRLYRRKDARLKHYREHHPWLASGPAVPRKHAIETLSSDSLDVWPTVSDSANQLRQTLDPTLDFDMMECKDEESPIANPEPSDYHTSELQTWRDRLPPFVQAAVDTFISRLSPVNYPLFFNTFLPRWEAILKELCLRGSDLHPVFAAALADFSEALESSDVPHFAHVKDENTHLPWLPITCKPTSNHSSTVVEHFHPYERTQGRDLTRLANSSKSSRRGPTRSPSKNFGNTPTIQVLEELEKDKSKKMDCPVHKHHIKYSLGTIQSPCNGFSATFMSEIRTHLQPNRSRRHGNFPSFIKECTRCTEDVVEERCWEHHQSNRCQYRRRTQGDRVLRWVRLYKSLYPGDPRVPSPFVNDYGWLSADIVSTSEQSMATPNTTLDSDSQNLFLGDDSTGGGIPSQQPAPLDLSQLSHFAALQLLIDDASRILSSLVAEAAETQDFGGQQIQSIVNQLTASHDARMESLQQRQSIADQSRTNHHSSLGSLQQDLSSTHSSTNLNPVILDPLAESEFGGTNEQQFHDSFIEPLIAPDMSTQPSSSGYETGSSAQNGASSHTDSSLAPDTGHSLSPYGVDSQYGSLYPDFPSAFWPPNTPNYSAPDFYDQTHTDSK